MVNPISTPFHTPARYGDVNCSTTAYGVTTLTPCNTAQSSAHSLVAAAGVCWTFAFRFGLRRRNQSINAQAGLLLAAATIVHVC